MEGDKHNGGNSGSQFESEDRQQEASRLPKQQTEDNASLRKQVEDLTKQVEALHSEDAGAPLRNLKMGGAEVGIENLEPCFEKCNLRMRSFISSLRNLDCNLWG